MLTCIVPSPPDDRLAALPSCLDSASVLASARESLKSVTNGERQEWKEARLLEAMYHPGRYARLVYALLKEPTIPTSRAWPEGQLVSLIAPVRNPMSRRGALLQVGRHDVEAYCFPNDRRLRGLRTFARRDLALAAWNAWLRPGEWLEEATLQRKLIRYVPEQKCVVRLRAEVRGPAGKVEVRRVAVRATSPGACRILEQRHRCFHDQLAGRAASFVVPGVVGADERRGLLALEWARGETLVDALRGGNEAQVMSRLARAVVEFHQLPPVGVVGQSPVEAMSAVDEALSDLGLATPESRKTLTFLRRELSEQAHDSVPGRQVTLHNDLHWNQWSIKSSRLTLMDLERVSVGDETIDVANLATQLEMLGARRDMDVDSETAARWRRMFLESWCAVRGESPDSRTFHLLAARSRLVLARGALRHLRLWWESFVADCMAMAVADVSRAAAREAIP